jgi:thioredoxin 1
MKPLTLTDDNFEANVLKSPTPVLVDFWAAWCGPCRAIGPAVDELADEYDGVATVAKLNVDDYPALASEYGVRGIPTLLVFDGGRVVDQIVGAVPKDVLASKLNARVEAA